MTTSAEAAVRGSPPHEKWEIVAAQIVPFESEWGVAYTFANGNGWSYRVGSREAAVRELLPPGSIIEPLQHGAFAPLHERMHLELSQVLGDLASSDVSVLIASFGGRGFDVRLGNATRGIIARKHFATHALAEAAAWLVAEARQHFPESAFARRYAIHPSATR